MDTDWILLAATMDVRYWRMLHDERCPNCNTEWRMLPAEANIIPHWQGDCKQVIRDAQEKEDAEFMQAVGIIW